jgi:O-6-methylguanine DNA methyltransferase
MTQNKRMKTIDFKTAWGSITVTLDDTGNAVELYIPPLTKTPQEKFAASDRTTLARLVHDFKPAGLPAGTAFQQAVWRELKKIPRGQTRTYGEVAAAIGCPKAVRAVGTACGANPLPLFIPCHRVVAQNGPGGFGRGLPWKLLLLEIEQDS